MGKRQAISIGEFIREQREQRRLSLRQAARASGVSFANLAKVERNELAPSDELLAKMAKLFKIHRDALFHQAGRLTPEGRRVIRETPDLYEALVRSTAKLNPAKREAITALIVEGLRDADYLREVLQAANEGTRHQRAEERERK